MIRRIAGTLLGLAFVVAALLFAVLGECTLHPILTYGTPPDPSAYPLFGVAVGCLVSAALTFYFAWRRRTQRTAPPPDAG